MMAAQLGVASSRGVLRCSFSQGDEQCCTRGSGRSSLTWWWSSGGCSVAWHRWRRVSVAVAGQKCSWGRWGGSYIGEGVHAGGELWHAAVAECYLEIILEFVTIVDSFEFLVINPLLWFPWTLCSEVLRFLASGERLRGARAHGVQGAHENRVECGGGHPVAQSKQWQGR
jgi:hypothetical protein